MVVEDTEVQTGKATGHQSLAEITIEDIERLVRNVKPEEYEGFLTSKELAQTWGMSTRAVQRRLTKLNDVGLLGLKQVPRRDIQGRRYWCTGYKLIDEVIVEA